MTTIKEQVIKLNFTNGDAKEFKPEPWKIYSGLPNETYHAQKDYESSSTVKPLLITVKHHEDSEFKTTDGMALGTQFHDTLECLKTGQDLRELITVIDSYPRNAKDPIAQFILKYHPIVHGTEYSISLEEMTDKKKGPKKDELLEVAHELETRFLRGKQKVTQETFDKSNLMVKAIEEHPNVGKLFKLESFSELSFFMPQPITIDGKKIIVLVRVRPDLLIEFEDQIWIIDWKSIGVEATEKNIRKACFNYRYDLSAAMYTDVISKFTDKPVLFRLVFCESNKPAKEKVRLIELSPYDMEAGLDDYYEALQNKAKWLRDQSAWTGFPLPETGVETISMRSY